MDKKIRLIMSLKAYNHFSKELNKALKQVKPIFNDKFFNKHQQTLINK